MLIIYSIACLTCSFAIRHTQNMLLSWCSILLVFCLAAHPFCSHTGITGLPTPWAQNEDVCWRIPNQYLCVSRSPQRAFHTGPHAVSLLSAQSWPALQHPCFILRLFSSAEKQSSTLEAISVPWWRARTSCFLHSLMYQETNSPLVYQF